MVDFLERYCALLDDAEAFRAALGRPLPVVVWANPLRADPHATDARIRARCPEAVPVPWAPHTWRLPPDATPGRWPEFLLGALHIQEEAALWAAPLLGAQPGERVFDLCAAPGNKTAQLAVTMQDRGLLWAGDRSAGRIITLRRALERLGVTCAATLRMDAAEAPALPGGFDRVLADVPCSCEGTTRKPEGRQVGESAEGRAFLVREQTRILHRGLSLLRPGGTLVYATCTYAPEENEGVLDTVPPDLAAIEPIVPPPGLRVRPGLTAFEGRTFRPDTAHAARLWPQDNDTGGFFVARLRRL